MDDQEMTDPAPGTPPKPQNEEESKEEQKSSSWLETVTQKLAKNKYKVVKSEEDGCMRFLQTKDDASFEFKDQKHYDLLGDLLCEWIQAYMCEQQDMHKVMVPFQEHLKEGKAQAPIFKSNDWETNTERALVLIQGTGDVRSGYWARSVCMNDTLDLGSMIPDIEFARKYGFSVLVLNPNYLYDENKVKVDDKIRGMNHHSNYCWKYFVENGGCPAKEIFMVAHSAGGGCAHEIIVRNQETMIERVKAIALTDACHGRFYQEMDKEGKQWAVDSCIAYDASQHPLDTPLENRYNKCLFPEVSAGHHKHVYTTGCARESYLPWFLKRSQTLKDEGDS